MRRGARPFGGPSTLLNLTPADIALHEALGISRDLLDRAGIARVTDLQARALISSRHAGDLSGVVYPYVDPGTGKRLTYRLRRDHPEMESGKPRDKYLSAFGDSKHLFFPPDADKLLGDTSAPVIVVEAEKSVLAVMATMERRGRRALAIGLGGCWGWRGRIGKTTDAAGVRVDEKGALPDLALVTWGGREVVIVFDANAATNSNVSAARRALTRELERRGARVRIANLPVEADVNGPDDYCAKHGDAAVLALLDAASGYDWPRPEEIQRQLPPVRAFSEELLPTSFRSLVRDVTERMQVPMDYPAVVIVLCLAGVVNRRATIQPKSHDTGWTVVPNLWGGIIAPPGFMKSAIIQAVISPLILIQTEWREAHGAALSSHALAQEEYDLRRAAWKEQFKATAKKGRTAPDRPECESKVPKLRRLIVNDATFEALHQTMSDNPAGILVVRDELTGWWSQLDRAGREGERAFCLQAWNGDTGHTIDRIGRGTVHVDACCMSMMGGIQPGRLRSYLVDALQDGPSNDGLIQRFQLLVWPDTPPDWAYVDRAPDGIAQDQASRIFRRLLELDPEKPARFRFAPEAHSLFVEWLSELETRIRTDELHPALVCHLSKYRKLMPALALLFELSDRASCVDFDGSALAHSPNVVSLEHVQQAVVWCDYLESHARRVYSCVVTPQLRAARELAEKIKARKIQGRFSCREIYVKGWSGLDSPEAVKWAADILEDAGWIRDVSSEPGPSGGRPSNRYEVNPRVWE